MAAPTWQQAIASDPNYDPVLHADRVGAVNPYYKPDTSSFDAFLKAQMDALRAATTANRQVYAPSLNLSAISSQARSQAANAVNPFYTKQLSEFLAQQAFEKQTQEAQAKTNIGNLQDQLNQTLGQNQITQGRTAQDVATNEANIATASDQYQTDQGQQAEIDRLALAKQQAVSGTTGSGVGAGQQLTAQTAQNTTESRQGAEFQKQKQQQELFKSRTFEDLARSGAQARTSTTKGTAQINFDLNNYIKQQSFALTSKKTDLEIARQNAIEQSAQKYGTAAVNKFIQSISNPAQRQAALQAYGGLTF